MVHDRIRIEALLSASSTLDGLGGEMQRPRFTRDHRGRLAVRILSAAQEMRNKGFGVQ